MKNRDYRNFNQAINYDFMVFVNHHPDAIDILLFRPDPESLETMAVDQDVVGAIESEERSIEYLDPVMTRAVLVPDDYLASAVDAGGEPDGDMAQPVAMLVGEPDVPQQSIVQYREYINDTDVRVVSLYVMRSEIIGEAPGLGIKHYCVPFQAFDYEFIEPPTNLTPTDGEEGVSVTPLLTASEFVLHCNRDDVHAKSQWQIRTSAGTYEPPIYDSGAIGDLCSHELAPGILVAASEYFWRVRYRGLEGDVEGEEAVWSGWSGETKFTTVSGG